MKTCLVVDDSSVIRKVARRILEGMHFEITEADDRDRLLRGRKVKKGKRRRCVAPSARNHRARRCTRTVPSHGSFTVTGSAGTNALRFTGRLAGRTLAPGNYRLIATVSGGHGPGSSASVGFRVSS